MKTKLERVSKILSTALVVLFAIVAILLVGVRLFGIKPLTVLSPSMAPKYPTGSIVYIVEVEPDELKVNDVITYELTANTTATHRIIEIMSDENEPTNILFRTKGDNNDEEDKVPVTADKVVGKVIFGIPLLGFVVTPPYLYIAIAIAAVLLLTSMVLEYIADGKKKKSSVDIEKQ